MKVFLAAASSPDSREHLKKTIIQRVLSNHIRRFAGKEALSKIGFQSAVGVWGLVKGDNNDLYWGKLSEDDAVLFNVGKEYVVYSRLLAKEINTELAKDLWERSKRTNSYYDRIIYLEDVKQIQLPIARMNELFAYHKDFKPSRNVSFVSVSDNRLEPVLSRYGSFERAVGIERTMSTGADSFSFTAKDFDSCTGKPEDAKYLRERFEKLREALKSQLGKDFSDFNSYSASPTERPKRGQKQGIYKDHMWLGFAHPKFEREQVGIQLQVWINDEDPLGIGIWIDRRAPGSRQMARENIDRDKESFGHLIQSLRGYDGHLSEGYKFEKGTRDMSLREIDEFIEHMTDDGTHVGVVRKLTEQEALAEGPKIVDLIVATFNELLSTYMFLVGERSVVLAPSDWSSLLGRDLAGLTDQILNYHEMKLAIDRNVVRRIIHHMAVGKHVVLIGPPGTGKTDVARRILHILGQEVLGKTDCVKEAVASYEWGRYEVIGGKTIEKTGEEDFHMGCVLEAIKERQLLLIDEFNRADMNRAFGEMFLALDHDVLPLRHDERPSWLDDDAKQTGIVKIPSWFRMICTLNDYDKSLLSEMSYGLLRRFAFVEISNPDIDVEKDIALERAKERLARQGMEIPEVSNEQRNAMDSYFAFINDVRKSREIGVATSIDILTYLLFPSGSSDDTPRKRLGEALTDYLLPQLDRLDLDTLNNVRNACTAHFGDNQEFGPFRNGVDEMLRRLRGLESIFSGKQ